ncbi:MAG: glycoside hydrolase family 95 protein, partial [Planctomycetota bacterium]
MAGLHFGVFACCVACVVVLSSLARAGSASGARADERLLWYRRPAGKWTEALPLGNGRLGGMVFGGVMKERIQLNEESLWAGEPFDVYPEDFAAHLKEVQRLVLAGKISDARALGQEKLTKSPTSYRSYEPLADLRIELDHAAKTQDYRRELDLSTGVARVEYRVEGVQVVREVFISAPDDCVAVRVAADRPGFLRGSVGLARKKDAEFAASADGRIRMDGRIVDVPKSAGGYEDNRGGSGPGGEHMRFAGRLLVKATGGAVRAEADRLLFEGADEVVALFTAATDFNLDMMNFDRAIDPGRSADEILSRASAKSWDDLLAAHVAEHGSMYGRVSLDLGASPRADLPTDERLNAVRKGSGDPGLEALYFQFGRYLLMGSSRRPGRVPANLQGIWSDRMWAPWEADFHLNINLQMNYWPADLCNLSETMESLSGWFARVAEKGRVSARKLYGARGWVAFTCTNLFGRTTPGGSTKSSQFQNGVLDPLAGAWMAMTLWRHYEFTRDEEFLGRRAYPVLKGAAEFILDYLVADAGGALVIVPST